MSAAREAVDFCKCLDLSTSVCPHIFGVSFGRTYELRKKESLDQVFVSEIWVKLLYVRAVSWRPICASQKVGVPPAFKVLPCRSFRRPVEAHFIAVS